MQIDSQPGAGFSQPRCSAGHSSRVASALQPGSSLHSTGIQRDRGRTMAAPGAAGLVVAGLAGRAGAGASGSGTTAQAASPPRIAAPIQARHRDIVMWLILLEALAALVILLLIVWWTMFSGRKKGERRRDDSG
jgi:hypothetical protein